eukprot:TRINITY_DN3888_c0_g5_i1.p3 TRINITY_DN3888_c0_g5~~TRINITY_DN3888_c0_g5_i1.p3  ORF type:complete len:334 (+),score=135.70 TRINITY_DN3888_c0_g5_i1:222-1223(+)
MTAVAMQKVLLSSETCGEPLVRTESAEMNKLYGEGDNDSVHSSSSNSYEEDVQHDSHCRILTEADDIESENEEEENGLTESCVRSSHDSNSSDQFLNEEDPSGSEQSHDSVSLNERPRSRYDGHPLGVELLEEQEHAIMMHKNNLVEEFMMDFHHKNKWSLSESRARAKILVTEGFTKERGHLVAQMKHLIEQDLLGQEPHPCRRFRYDHRFRCAGFNAHDAHTLENPELMRRTVEVRMANLYEKWGTIMHAVNMEMLYEDNFPNVIKNLSTMRIFLEGHQTPSYCPDVNERARRCRQYQAVIENVCNGDNGLFLRDALPRAPPLDYCRNPRL